MKRITPEVKKIADAHLAARESKKFDNDTFASLEELIRLLRSGKTISSVMDHIEENFMPVTSAILGRVMDYQSKAYKAATYKAFKHLLQ